MFFVLLDYLEMAEAAGCGGVFAVHLPVSARLAMCENFFFFFFLCEDYLPGKKLDGAFLEPNKIIIYTFVTQQTTYCKCQSNQYD